MPVLYSAATAAIVTYLMAVVLRRIALRYKIYPAIRSRDVHVTPTPRLGGIAMYCGLLTGLGVASLFPSLRDAAFIQNGTTVTAVILAATLIVAMGIADDLLDLHWSIKLAAQTIAAVILAYIGGLGISQLPVGSLGTLVTSNRMSLVITILLVLVVINMMNFIDGLDGLVAGITIIANITYAVYTLLLTQETDNPAALTLGLLLTVTVCAICIGFLPLNWHPAKLFMGDAGSMLIGLMFAATALTITGNVDPTRFFATDAAGHYLRANLAPAFLPLLLPFAVMIVPLLDFTLAVSRRLLAGKSPFSADRKHLHHRLLDMGHSPLHATLIFYALTAIISAGSLIFYLTSPPLVAWAFIGGGLTFVAAVTLLPLSRRKQQEQFTQTQPISTISPAMAAQDRLDKASMRD